MTDNPMLDSGIPRPEVTSAPKSPTSVPKPSRSSPIVAAMPTDSGAESIELDTYPYEIETSTVGNVDEVVVGEIAATVRDVFGHLKYSGKPPEFVSISQGAVLLPSGEEIPACYGHDAPGIPGRIYVSSDRSKAAFGNSEIPTEVATAAFAAHEAVEHVNHMQGRELLHSHSLMDPKVHAEAATEQEANSIAREIIERRYGWTVNLE